MIYRHFKIPILISISLEGDLPTMLEKSHLFLAIYKWIFFGCSCPSVTQTCGVILLHFEQMISAHTKTQHTTRIVHNARLAQPCSHNPLSIISVLCTCIWHTKHTMTTNIFPPNVITLKFKKKSHLAVKLSPVIRLLIQYSFLLSFPNIKPMCP